MFRPQQPALYNPRNLKFPNDTQTRMLQCDAWPQILQTQNENGNSILIDHPAQTDDNEQSERNDNDVEVESEHENTHDEELLNMPNNEEEQNQIEGVVDEETVNYDESVPEEDDLDEYQTDDKHPLEDVLLDAREAEVFGTIFHANESVIHSPGGNTRVVIDDDCELIFETGREVFKPMEMGYQVKINDALSGNCPFKQNVSIEIKKKRKL